MSTLAEKRRTFLNMLDQGMTMVHLDARVDGIDVPQAHQDDPALRLNFSYKFNLSTFTIEDDAIRASLSFSGQAYLCIIPWEAVFAVTSHVTNETQVWEESMPPELLEQLANVANSLAEGNEGEDENVTESDDDDDIDLGGAVRRVGHLRVIK